MAKKRILLVDTYYPEFVKNIYQQQPVLAQQAYNNQLRILLDQCFGTSDYYSKNLINLGYEAEDVIADNFTLQLTWAKEHQISVRRLPALSWLAQYTNRLPLYKILLAQVKKFQPDVLYMQNIGFCDPIFLRKLKKHTHLLVGQIACPLPPTPFLKPYDLILTSFPHFVDRLRAIGIASEYFKIGFESTILDKIKDVPDKKYDVVFIGGFTKAHSAATQVLEELAKTVKLDIWGYGLENLPSNSILRKNFHGEAWGLDMYRIIKQAKICINRHSSAAENYANNMRLYETTGLGTLLITDQKDNLSNLFTINKEVIAYTSVLDLIEKVQHCLSHDQEREQIAQAGQIRTLKDHAYNNRMQELNQILNSYLQYK